MTFTFAHSESRSMVVPENEITSRQDGHTYHPLRGSAHTMAVTDASDRCVGWILAETLGCRNVREWMERK